MVTAGDDDQLRFVNSINQAVRFVDAPRPEALEGAFQWLRLTYSRERCSLCIGDELVDAFEGLSILGLPVEIIRPGFVRPSDLLSFQ